MLVSQQQLEEVTTYHRSSDIIKWLEKHGIKYWAVKGGKVMTTMEAINDKLLDKNDSEIEFE